MLLRDLHALHERLLDQRLMLPEGFRRSRVNLVVDLDLAGRIRSATAPEDDRGRPLERVIPDLPRTSKIDPLLIADKLGYVLSLPDRPDRLDRPQAQWTAYQDLLRNCIAAVPPAPARRVAAVQAATADPSHLARQLADEHRIGLQLQGGFEPDGSLSQDELKQIKDQSQWLIDFTVEGRRFFPSIDHQDLGDPDLVSWWSVRAATQTTSSRIGYCQATDTNGPLARLLPGIGELPGNSPRLISCNFDAASRYGASQSDGAAVSAAAAGRATQALKWLAGERRDEHRWNLEELVLLWWCPDDLEWDPLQVLREPDPAAVRRVFTSHLWTGRPLVNEISEFRMALLTVNTARVVVRADHVDTLNGLQQRLRHWFDSLQTVWDRAPNARLGIPDLAAAVCPPGRNRAAQRARVATHLIRHALMGDPLPLALRGQVVCRCAIGYLDRQNRRRHVSPAQAALLHAIAQSLKENPMPGSQAELCGRLLAILEHTQQRALGRDLNRGVQDSYGAAAATPRLVFHRLLSRRNAHISRLRRSKKDSTVRYLNRQMESVMADLWAAGGFPPQLTPAGQAEFGLGYWHQRHDMHQPTAASNHGDSTTDQPDHKEAEIADA